MRSDRWEDGWREAFSFLIISIVLMRVLTWLTLFYFKMLLGHLSISDDSGTLYSVFIAAWPKLSKIYWSGNKSMQHVCRRVKWLPHNTSITTAYHLHCTSMKICPVVFAGYKACFFVAMELTECGCNKGWAPNNNLGRCCCYLHYNGAIWERAVLRWSLPFHPDFPQFSPEHMTWHERFHSLSGRQ